MSNNYSPRPVSESHQETFIASLAIISEYFLNPE